MKAIVKHAKRDCFGFRAVRTCSVQIDGWHVVQATMYAEFPDGTRKAGWRQPPKRKNRRQIDFLLKWALSFKGEHAETTTLGREKKIRKHEGHGIFASSKRRFLDDRLVVGRVVELAVDALPVLGLLLGLV